ncbi:transcriptional regulator, HxlR family [Litoreibacter albidus]|uniref:Transcriptional regulator, HxlR family n=2 Tax=Litoreibacter albidus TaxID=670155 RepID=A0A1H2WPR3_9RHOB|nr:transcriptional regulator, HxlR family [Litoreibacter albidus]
MQVRTFRAYRHHMDTVKTPTPHRFDSYGCSDGCPVEAALEQISGKWKGLIIFHLLEETLRFSELSRRVGSVTQRSLTKQLRELEADGIVDRKVYPVVPPRVEYSLTEKGAQLRDVIEALRGWGQVFRR